MNWRHKMALEAFVRASRPLRFHLTPGMGEATWKALMNKGWIEGVMPLDGRTKWWQAEWRITDAGRLALDISHTRTGS